MAFPTSLTSAVDGTTTVLAAHLNNVEAKIGIDGSAVTTSFDYKLGGVATGDKAVSLTGTETITNKTLISPIIQSWGGWIDANETWTYASADDPTYTFTVAADVTTKYSAGMRIKLTQTTIKYFIITSVSSYSGGNTTITVYGGTDYDLTAAAISGNYYSMEKIPAGFPLSPSKWQVVVTDANSTTQSPATASVWYNVGGISISIPIGVWRVSYRASVQDNAAAQDTDMKITLSTANNSQSDASFSSMFNDSPTGATAHTAIVRLTALFEITLTAKTTHYLNLLTSKEGSALSIRGSLQTTVVTAECAFL